MDLGQQLLRFAAQGKSSLGTFAQKAGSKAQGSAWLYALQLHLSTGWTNEVWAVTGAFEGKQQGALRADIRSLAALAHG